MATPGSRALFNLHHTVALQCKTSLLPIQLTCTWLSIKHYTMPPIDNAPKPVADSENVSLLENLNLLKPVADSENVSLLENLNLLGVDVKMARQRQPGVLRKVLTNEQGLAQFLQAKGASRKVVAGIISRFPRAITRSVDHLEQRWRLWRSIFKSDSEVVSILDRSPESFFRSSDNDNLQKNIVFLTSLGLTSKHLYRLLTKAPRTFSNSVELNRQMVEFLEEVSGEHGGEFPQQFVKAVISRNVYILIRSTKRVKKNIDTLKTVLKLSDSELLVLLQGPVAEILDLSNEYLNKNFKSLQQKMASFGCHESDIKKLVSTNPVVLFIGPDTLSTKLDCLLKGGVTMEQIVEKPKVLEYSTQNIAARLQELQKVGYDLQNNGIGILDTSRKRFDAKIEKLTVTAPQDQ